MGLLASLEPLELYRRILLVKIYKVILIWQKVEPVIILECILRMLETYL